MENKDKVKIEKLEAQITFMRITEIIVSFNDSFDEVLEFYKEHFAKDKNKSYMILACEFAEFIVEAMNKRRFTPQDVAKMGVAYFFRWEMKLKIDIFLSNLGQNLLSWGYVGDEYGMDGVCILANFRSGLTAEFCRDFLKDVDLSKAGHFERKAIKFLKG